MNAAHVWNAPLAIMPPPEETRTERRRRHVGLLQQVLNELGNPERAAPVVHVTGTNGKGSTSNFITEVLIAAGARVGHAAASGMPSFAGFPLPGDLRARARLLADPVAWPILARNIPADDDRHDLRNALLEHFAYCLPELDTAVRVIEVGTGGFSDLSNVVQPAVSVLTNVTLDHTDLFGETVEDIAREKSGIIKAGAPAVTAEANPAVLEVFRRRAEEVGTELHVLDRSRILESSTALSGTSLQLETDTWGELALHSTMVGVHQVDNIALAVRALELLPEHLRPAREHVTAGIAGARWPGRFQVMGYRGATVILDGAHNEAGAKALADTLEAVDAPRPRVAVLACLERKDTAPIVREVSRVVDYLVLTPIGRPLMEPSWDTEEAATHASCNCETFPYFRNALHQALQAAIPNGTVIAAGSLHTAEDALGIICGMRFG